MNKVAKSLLLLLVLILTGCGSTQPLVPEVRYLEKECPTPKAQPEFIPYEAIILEINGEEYYALPKSEAVKLGTNWISYKSWAETNFKLMEKK